jgi:dolichol-phosphate mannosyltransferase
LIEAALQEPVQDPGFIPSPTGPFRIGAADTAGFPVRFSLVVPTYNEAANVQSFLTAVQNVLDPILGSEYELVLVDDDSPDRTWEIAGELLSSFPQLRIVRRRIERGLSGAVMRGWQVARGEILGTINADFQHPPSLLGAMLDQARQSDLVVASRFVDPKSMDDATRWRRLTAGLARQVGRWVIPEVFHRVSDPLSGCYLIKRRAIQGAEFHPIGFKSLLEVLSRVQIASVSECGYRIQRRRQGKSKLNLVNWYRFIVQLGRIRAAGAK